MDTEKLKQMVTDYKEGTLSETELFEALKFLPFEDIGFAKIDHHRALRTGLPEVIYGEGKTTEQVLAIAAAIVEKKDNLLVTRVAPDTAAHLSERFPDGEHNDQASIFFYEHTPQEKSGHILVVTAGTTDIPVAEEAAITAALFGCNVERIYDVGVAGVHRLMAHRDQLTEADVLIVAAGMEGALASVVASMTDVPVIALPTSVGYGASFGGLAALLGMMTSCAAGVSVVNIDNGFGAGCSAALITRRIRLLSQQNRGVGKE